MHQNFKSWLHNETLLLCCLVVVVGLTAFWLGRASVPAESTPVAAVVAGTPFTAPNPTQTAQPPTPVVATDTNSDVRPETPIGTSGQYVASKSGTKYHLTSCPGAKQIKDTNKLFFNSEAEAMAAGYTRAANCLFQ